MNFRGAVAGAIASASLAFSCRWSAAQEGSGEGVILLRGFLKRETIRSRTPQSAFFRGGSEEAKADRCGWSGATRTAGLKVLVPAAAGEEEGRATDTEHQIGGRFRSLGHITAEEEAGGIAGTLGCTTSQF